MTEPNAPTFDDPRWHPDVRERWKKAGATALANLDAINAAIGDEGEELEYQLAKLLVSNRSVRSKLRGLYQLVDEFAAYAKGRVPCKKGCSHCCYIAAPISVTEAQMIAEATGIEAKPLKPGRLVLDEYKNIKGFSWGYHNPCTFLKDGACSIYEHRPLVCRTHFILDEDELLCVIRETEHGHRVPFWDLSRYRTAGQMITGSEAADIREFFPRKEETQATPIAEAPGC